MTEQEQKDLDLAKAEVQKIQLDTFDYMRHVSRWTSTDLLHAGYRNCTRAEALEKIFNASVARIEKVFRNHLKKYPDEK